VGNLTGDLAIDVPPGRHEIRIDNGGQDRFSFSRIILTKYRNPRKYPDLDVLGQQTDDLALVWLHNRLSLWALKPYAASTNPPGPGILTLGSLRPGTYRVEWWDTYAGTITRTESLAATATGLALPFATVERDSACKIARTSQ
jgi:hypothetical protein